MKKLATAALTAPAAKHPSESAAKQLTFQVKRKLTKSGMTGAQLHSLDRLFCMLKPGALVQVTGTYLAKSLGISSQMANRYLRQFEALGLITRFRHFIMPALKAAITGVKRKIARQKKGAKSLFLRNLKRALKPLVSQDPINIKTKQFSEAGAARQAEAAAILSKQDVETYWLKQMGL